MSDNRHARYEEDGRVIYRASSLMMCDRMFIALSENYTPQAHPEWFQEVLNEGTESEAQIIAMYEEQFDVPVIGQQQTVEIEVLDGVWIRGHIDGLEGPDGDKLFEAKKFRESTWMKFKRQGVECMPWYPWQVSVYMHGMEVEECHFVGGLYKDKKIEEIYVHHLTQPPIPWRAIVKRVAALEAMVEAGKRVDDVKCNVHMFPCPFFYLHDQEEDKPKPNLEADEYINSLVDAREAFKAETAALNKRAKEIEPELKEINKAIEQWLKDRNVDDDQVVKVGDHEVKYHVVYRSGYVVNETDYTTVTVKKAKEAAKPRGRKGSKNEDE